MKRDGNETDKNKNKRLIYAILITGIVLLTLPSFMPEKKEEVISYDKVSHSIQKEELKMILSAIEGVGECEVMISYKSSGEYVIAKDKSKSGDTSEEKNVITGSGSGEKPFVVREEMPIVQGVVAVCEGGADEGVRNSVVEAICALCGIGPGKVKVYKK